MLERERWMLERGVNVGEGGYIGEREDVSVSSVARDDTNIC